MALQQKDETLLFGLSALKEQPVINTDFAGQPVAVFSFEQMNSALDGARISESRPIPSAAVYSASIDGQSLEFNMQDGFAVDAQTGSTWNIFGVAEAGPLQGKQLDQLDNGVHFAFAWFAFDPEAKIYQP